MSLSIAVEQDTAQFPVYIVEGSNWTCEVETDQLDGENLDVAGQMIEAATKAIEACKGIQNGCEIRITDEGLVPHWGLQVLVHPKGENPDKSTKAVNTYEILANGGFYMDSIEALAILKMELKKLEDDKKREEAAKNPESKAKADAIAAAQKKRKKKLAKEIKDFEQFQKNIKKEKPE
jgi:hypothetical protein